MYDFFTIKTKLNKGKTIIFPEFMTIIKSKDLMIRGNDFYAIWNDDTKS